MTEPAPTQPEQVAGIVLQPDAALVPRTPQLNLPELSDHPSSWELLPHVATLSRMVANTEFVPEKFRNRPAAVAGAMLLGHELGLGPMASLRGLYVTKDGDILMPAQTMRAVVRKAGHRIWPGEHTSTRCTWHGMRADDADHEYQVTWTIDDARAAHLIKDRSAWLTTPRAMLSARASSELCRILAEDALAGVPYSAEEVDDQVVEAAPAKRHPDEPDLTGPEPAPGTQRRTRRGAAAPAQPAVTATVIEPARTARAAATPPAPAGPDLSLPVPGDDPPPEAELPMPAVVAEPVLPPAQMLAMACREANLDRALVCRAVSRDRTDSARELSDQEAVIALDHVRAVSREEELLVVNPEGRPFFERTPREG